MKLLKAAALIAVGVGALSLVRGTPILETWIRALGADPEGHFVNRALAKILDTQPRQLREIGAGSLIYASLFLVEGTGLLLRRLWAEYVTIVITSSFIPLEVYEMIEKESVPKAIVIALNVAIVIYLVLRLRRDHHWPFRRARGARGTAKPEMRARRTPLRLRAAARSPRP